MAEANHTSRRDSLSRSAATKQRPKLLRSSATEPSITAANAIKGSLVIPASPKRAAEILSKMAIYPLTHADPETRAPTRLIQHQSETVMVINDSGGHAVNVQNEDSLLNLNSDCYYSFPSFEGWDTAPQGIGQGNYD